MRCWVDVSVDRRGPLFFGKCCPRGGGGFAAPPVGHAAGCTMRVHSYGSPDATRLFIAGDCLSTCVESHWGSMPPHDGGGAHCWSRHPLAPPRERCPLFLLWLFLFGKMCCHRSCRRRRCGVLWARGVLKLRCDLTFHRERAVMTPVSSRIRSRVPPHDGGEVRCWACHPLAPTPGSGR